MFCSKCGTQNDDNAFRCVQCGNTLQQAVSPYVAAPPGTSVPSYLAFAILVTLFCCLPFGIVGIVYAAQANGKAAAGDYAGALENANTAKTWCWVSLGIGLFWPLLLLWLLVVALGGVASILGN